VGIICVLLVARPAPAQAAGVETVAGYKHRVSSLCVAATPRLVRSVRAVKHATSRAGLSAAFDRYVALALDLDKTILGIPVPAPLRGDMAPLLRLTRQSDALAVAMARALRAGDVSRFGQLSTQLDATGRKYDRIADALGLRACGSDITRALSRA
jgi:hypothetical protein